MRHNGFQFILRQELPFLAVGTDMKLREGIAWYLAVTKASRSDKC